MNLGHGTWVWPEDADLEDNVEITQEEMLYGYMPLPRWDKKGGQGLIPERSCGNQRKGLMKGEGRIRKSRGLKTGRENLQKAKKLAVSEAPKRSGRGGPICGIKFG